MNSNGTNQQMLNINESWYDQDSPTWSPDDSKIAFVSFGPSGYEKIYVYNLSTATVTNITPADQEINPWGDIARLSWGPTNRIAYDRYPIGIQTINSYGGDYQRITNISEFDRVLGGGFMQGSVVLIGGDPGIGKSTLVMQAAAAINKTVLFVSGEESTAQINLRAKRLKLESNHFYILAEVDLNTIEAAIKKIKPDVVMIDSIQTMQRSELDNAPGTITQIRECASYLMQLAKRNNFVAVLIGHITKEGYIAGPKILEHMVDTVLQFEGEKNHNYRILRLIFVKILFAEFYL